MTTCCDRTDTVFLLSGQTDLPRGQNVELSSHAPCNDRTDFERTAREGLMMKTENEPNERAIRWESIEIVTVPARHHSWRCSCALHQSV